MGGVPPPFFSPSWALPCTFLHSAKKQLCCFQSIAHSFTHFCIKQKTYSVFFNRLRPLWKKPPGVGGGEYLPSYSFSLTISSYAARLVSPRSLAASFRASLRSSLAWRMSSSTRSARLCAEFACVRASAGASGPTKNGFSRRAGGSSREVESSESFPRRNSSCIFVTSRARCLAIAAQPFQRAAPFAAARRQEADE